MNDLNLPLTPLSLEECLKEILSELHKCFVLDSNFLIYISTNVSQSSNITSLMSSEYLDMLFDAVNNGYELRATGENKYFKIIYADTEEISSDNYKAVKIVFIKDNELIKLVFTRFGSKVYLDTKTITAI